MGKPPAGDASWTKYVMANDSRGMEVRESLMRASPLAGEGHLMKWESWRGKLALIEQLIALAGQLQANMSSTCEAMGVNAPRFAVLRAIANDGDRGCSQAELAMHLGLSESNVCALVERLRLSGLLFRFRAKFDRRRSVLVLTEQGRQLAEAIAHMQEAEAVAWMSALNDEQLHLLQQLLAQLHEHLNTKASRVSEGIASMTPAGSVPPATPAARRAS